MDGLITKLMAFEEGELDYEDTILFFQELVNTGVAWHLQGSYGRMAAALLETGEVTHPA